MATAPNPRRGHEAGLSLIEAMVIVTITALLALILLPMTENSGRRNWAIADAEVNSVAAANAEQEFRALVRAANLEDGFPSVNSAGQILTLKPVLARPSLCAAEGDSGAVRLFIAGNALVCGRADRERTLFRWPEGLARFEVSPASDGSSVQVQFTLRARGGRGLTWIEPAGSAIAPAALP